MDDVTLPLGKQCLHDPFVILHRGAHQRGCALSPLCIATLATGLTRNRGFKGCPGVWYPDSDFERLEIAPCTQYARNMRAIKRGYSLFALTP